MGLSEIQTHENIQIGKLGHRCSVTGLSVGIKHTMFVFPQPVKYNPVPDLRGKTLTLLSLLPLASSHAHFLSPHLPEGRPFLLLLHVGVVARVLRVVAGVTVGVEDVGCAEFVQRSKSNT